MNDIVENLRKVESTLLEGVKLVAVTKTHSVQEINTAIDAGVTDIGENKVQEILDKYDHVKPVRWHMIGHLQRNKVKYIIDKVCLIHSVDSLRLAQEIDRRAAQHNLVMDILLQVSPAHEESKFGVPIEDTETLLRDILRECPHVRVCGLMCVAPFAEDPKDVKMYFDMVKAQYDELGKIQAENLDFRYLSMGMSHDYQVAMEAGSNMVRVGSAIFGKRVY
ncbi:MAG: YggS family pyridoxal phosphate-dependent enzyme [Eubacteriales bacterium]|jgi:pyridoxal phosphate enzyme (YggS family)|nr:YggS family pyridoxal phosphate-dependent enzyme [Eubacteriales bacterium]